LTRKGRLLIRLGSLGDVVLATAVANAAMAKWGPHCLDVLVKAEWEGIWENHPAVRHRIAWAADRRGPSGLVRLARRLAKTGYRATLDLQSSPRTRLLTALAGLSDVRRPRLRRRERRRLVHLHRGGPPPGYRVVDSFLATLGTGARALPSVHPDPDARARARALLPERGGLGLAPGARHATKRWPVERFVTLGREAATRGQVAVFFGPGEATLRREWEARWPADGGWVGIQERIPATSACLARLDRLVTNDTGLMHLAAAVGTPVVALFGPTVRNFGFAPAGEGHRLLEVDGLACRPCSLHGGPRCPREHFRCMLELDVGLVRDTLASPAPPREEIEAASSPAAARTLVQEN
jgi:heptosyltransferase-2